MAISIDSDGLHELSGIGSTGSLLSSNDQLLAGIRVTRAQFARMMGCSRQAVSEWVRDGRLTVGSDGRFDPRQAVASLLRTGDPARLRARILKPLADELAGYRSRIYELEAAVGQAMQRIETERAERSRLIADGIAFHEGAVAELLDVFDALRAQIGDAWPVLAELPENGGAKVLVGWLDLALEYGAEKAGPILLAALETGKGEGRAS